MPAPDPTFSDVRPGRLLRLLRLLARALTRRCPNCGHGGIFLSWFRLRSSCLECGLRLDRGEPGYQVGAYMFNLIAAELVFVAAMGGVVVSTWPEPPWELLTWGGAALMILLPVVFYPFAKTLFLAFDLVFRPAEEDA
ncbi:MAG TPA: DUF983 domain-containing protein [Gemmatimonadales bacterium]|nr:DUF983 domain-containing protein [Gemmatimonadales bacterium]